MTVEVCPECRAGKHSNCDGTSWDETADAPAPCPCTHDGWLANPVAEPLLGVAYPEEHQEANDERSTR